MAVKRMPRKKDRRHFSRDAMRGRKDTILGRGLMRGGPRI